MNTKQLKMTIAIVFVALFTIQETLAQQGMDYAGGPTFRYARLRKTVNQNSGNEKAMGVYNADIFPSTTLDINTTTTYLPFLHPNLGGDRGLVFRSVAPAGFTQQWQMFRDNTQVFRLFNTQNTDDITLETSLNGNLIFHTNATERLRITAAGQVQIQHLACNDCLVMANQQGELYTDNQTIKNLENKIKYLEEKLVLMEKLLAENQ